MTFASIDSLYEDHPETYAQFSNDRRFDDQVGYLVNSCLTTTTGLRFLELFAGPAQHCRSFVRCGYGAAVAIDASVAMKRVSDKLADSPDYFISMLPAFPSELLGAELDLIFAPRYSTGYISFDHVSELLTQCMSRLRLGGSAVFELHDPRSVIAQMEQLTIRTRSFDTVTGESGSVVWPAGSIRLSRDGWIAEMDVTIEQPSLGISTYTSREYLHTASSLRVCANQLGAIDVSVLEGSETLFPDAVLVSCKKKNPENS